MTRTNAARKQLWNRFLKTVAAARLGVYHPRRRLTFKFKCSRSTFVIVTLYGDGDWRLEKWWRKPGGNSAEWINMSVVRSYGDDFHSFDYSPFYNSDLVEAMFDEKGRIKS